MANNATPKLKAYVQVDATGRVVSGTPVFRSSKPKIGNWREIPMYYRGDNLPTTTTTTTAGGVTPTAFVLSYWLNVSNSCNGTTQGTSIFYSASTTIQSGIGLFTDASLTTPATQGWVVNNNMTRYVIGANGVLTEIYCLDNFYFGATAQIACSQSSPAQLLYAAASTASIDNGTTIYAYFASLSFPISIGQIIYMRFSPGFAATVPVEVTSATTGTVISTPTAC